MHKLKVIATTLAAGLFALGLSVGASLAEGTPAHSPVETAAKSNHWAPTGLCLLDGKTVRVAD